MALALAYVEMFLMMHYKSTPVRIRLAVASFFLYFPLSDHYTIAYKESEYTCHKLESIKDWSLKFCIEIEIKM